MADCIVYPHEPDTTSFVLVESAVKPNEAGKYVYHMPFDCKRKKLSWGQRADKGHPEFTKYRPEV